jgi:hypothetical protein
MNRISFDDKVDARVLGGARINKVIADDMNQIKTAINTLVDSGADLPQFSTAARDLITPAPPLGYRIYNTTENRGEYYTSGGWLPFMGLKDIHAGSSPNFPSSLRGDILRVTANGRLGGVSGLLVGIGDLLICTTANAGGTFASVGANWILIRNSEPISITKSELLNLIATNFVLNATYKVTDIKQGLFVQGISPNKVSLDATLLLYAPAYVVSGSYKGQYHAQLGAVANGEKYTWGSKNYQNNSGGSLTPDTPSENVFDTANRFALLPTSDASYQLVSAKVKIDNLLNLIQIENTAQQNTLNYYFTTLNSVDYADAALAQLFLKPDVLGTFTDGFCYGNKGVVLLNNRIEFSDGYNVGISNNIGGTFETSIKNCLVRDLGYLNTDTFGIYANNLFDSGIIENVVGSIRVGSNNIIGGTSYIKNITCVNGGYIDILHCEIHDNSHIEDWVFSGSGGQVQFWDNHLHENNDFTNFTITMTTGIYAMNNGHYNHSVDIDNYTITKAGTFQLNFGNNLEFTNCTDLNIENSSFSFTKLPLQTFNALNDITIVNQTIDGNAGSLSFKIDFSATTLTAGNSFVIGLLPTGSYATDAVLIVSGLSGGAGALLRVGIPTDSADYITAATALASVVNAKISTLSAITTGNRGIEVAATVANITGGTISIKVDFVN